jgi:hypothetical protein
MMQPLGVALYELSHYAGRVLFFAALSAVASSPACRWPNVIGSIGWSKRGMSAHYWSRFSGVTFSATLDSEAAVSPGFRFKTVMSSRDDIWSNA